MDSIQKTIQNKITDTAVEKISQYFKMDASSVKGVIDKALPAILSGLGRNVQTPQGAEELDKALEKDHDGSLLDNSDEKIGDKAVMEDGQKILGHIFGDKLDVVENAIGKTTDTSTGKVNDLMTNLAPFVLEQLGKEKKEQNLDAQGVSEVINNEKEDADSKLSGIMNLIDQDDDGSVVDDIVDFGKGFLKK